METTIKISLNGLAFSMEEDAYRLLKNYLDSLKEHFYKSADGREIVEDIEARMAELLLVRIDSLDKTVTVKDAREVIDILGTPEDMGEVEGSKIEPEPQPVKKEGRRKLYRDPQHAVIAGVCSGLANYLRIDRVWVRLIFIGLLLFFPIATRFSVPFPDFHHYSLFIPSFIKINLALWVVILYIVLWIAVPRAITPGQQAEMLGSNDNVKDIADKVRKERREQKVHAEAPAKVKVQRERTGPSTAARVWGVIGRIMLIILGCWVTLMAMAMLLAFMGVLIAGNLALIGNVDVNPEALFLMEQLKHGIPLITQIAVLVIIFLPLFGLLYLGLKLIFRIKSNGGKVFLVGFFLWLVAWITLLVSMFTNDRDWREFINQMKTIDRSISINEKQIVEYKAEKLYVSVPDEYKNLELTEADFWRNRSKYRRERTEYLIPKVRVHYTDESELSIKACYDYSGIDWNTVKKNYSWEYNIKDSVLLIKPLEFHHKKNNRSWIGSTIFINVPSNKTVILEKPFEQE